MCYALCNTVKIRHSPIHAHHKYNNTVTYVMRSNIANTEQLPKMIKHMFCVIKRDRWVIKQHDKTVIKPFHIALH